MHANKGVWNVECESSMAGEGAAGWETAYADNRHVRTEVFQ